MAIIGNIPYFQTHHDLLNLFFSTFFHAICVNCGSRGSLALLCWASLKLIDSILFTADGGRGSDWSALQNVWCPEAIDWCLAGKEGMIPVITSNNNPNNPQSHHVPSIPYVKRTSNSSLNVPWFDWSPLRIRRGAIFHGNLWQFMTI